jgi:hypothetical protein
MNRVTRVASFALLAAALGLFWAGNGQVLAAKAEEPSPVSGDKPDEARQVVRQADIMAEVLEIRIKEALGQDLVTDDVFQSGGVRGYRIPGLGVVFLAHVKFPLAEGEVTAAAEPAKSEEDALWDRIEQGTRGLDDTWWKSIKVTEENRKEIETLQRVVVNCLAKYGHRLTAVGPEENIIVLIGSGTTGGALKYSLLQYQLSSKTEPAGRATEVPKWRVSGEMPATSWILAVKKSDLTADPDELQKRARIRVTRTTSKEDAKVVRDLTVMSRILEMNLGSDLPNEIVSVSMVQRGVEGFYVPGVGAFFFLEAKFPLAEGAAAEKKKESEDLWDSLERDLGARPTSSISIRTDRGGVIQESRNASAAQQDPFAAKNADRRVAVLRDRGYRSDTATDKGKIERLKSAIFKVIARYGKRLEEVAGDERIVVVVTGKSGGVVVEVPVSRNVNPFQSDKSADPAVATQWMALLQDITASGHGGSLAFGQGSVLIISIAKKDLVDDPAELAKRATVESYAGVRLAAPDELGALVDSLKYQEFKARR